MHDIDTVRMEYENVGEGLNPEAEFEDEASLSEAEEEMLAAELLGVTSEAELDQFFGKLFKKIGKGLGGVGRFLKKNAGPLVGALKGIAKAALPTVGAALGSAIPIPGVGTAVGGMLGNAASSMLEAELEGLNEEDREFEMAKRFVRLTKNAARAGGRRPHLQNRRAAIMTAIREAMRQQRARQLARRRARAGSRRGYGPGPGAAPTFNFQDSGAPDGGAVADDGLDAGDLGDIGDDGLGDTDPSVDAAPAETPTAQEFEWEGAPIGGARSGRWVRRGGKIVLLGV